MVVWVQSAIPAGVITSQAGDAPQLPNLLNGYAARPPAGTVAGVDFYVGCPSSVVLKNCQTDTLPSGVTRNTTTRIISVGNNNTVMDGWNFNVSGGYRVVCSGDNCTFNNCVWGGASQDGFQPLLFQVIGGTVGQTITNCTIDGTGTTSANFSGLVNLDSRDNNLTVNNCWLKNAPSDAINSGGGLTTAKNNLMQAIGFEAGSHPDGIQNTINAPATTPSWEVQNNTVFSTVLSGLQGFIISNQTYGTSNVLGNTIIGVADSYFIGCQAACSGLITFSGNYIDLQGGTGFGYPGSVANAGGAGHCVFGTPNANINMVTGAALSTNP